MAPVMAAAEEAAREAAREAEISGGRRRRGQEAEAAAEAALQAAADAVFAGAARAPLQAAADAVAAETHPRSATASETSSPAADLEVKQLRAEVARLLAAGSKHKKEREAFIGAIDHLKTENAALVATGVQFLQQAQDEKQKTSTTDGATAEAAVDSSGSDMNTARSDSEDSAGASAHSHGKATGGVTASTDDATASQGKATRENSPQLPAFEDTPTTEPGTDSELSRLAAELEEQCFARELAEGSFQKMKQERDALMQRLRSAERSQMLAEMQVRTLTNEVNEARLQRQLDDAGIQTTATTLEEVVKTLVTVELEQLRSCAADERVATKRKLLLRWHPDKNSSSGGGGSDLATRVMQEMQSRSEWSDTT